MADQFVTGEQLAAQFEVLDSKMPARITLDTWFRTGAAPRPHGVGGRGKERVYDHTTAPEIFAGMSLLLGSTGAISKAQIRYIRDLALLIEGCQSPQDVLAIAKGFTRGAQGRNIEGMGADIVYWLRKKRKAMRMLYGKTEPEFEKRRDEYFESPEFSRLVWGLTSGFFDGYRFEGNRLITPEKKTSMEAEALRKFPKAA